MINGSTLFDYSIFSSWRLLLYGHTKLFHVSFSQYRKSFFPRISATLSATAQLILALLTSNTSKRCYVYPIPRLIPDSGFLIQVKYKKLAIIHNIFLYIVMNFYPNPDLVQAPFLIKTSKVFVPPDYPLYSHFISIYSVNSGCVFSKSTIYLFLAEFSPDAAPNSLKLFFLKKLG